MNTLDALDAESLRTDVPDFRPGDTDRAAITDTLSRCRPQAFRPL